MLVILLLAVAGSALAAPDGLSTFPSRSFSGFAPPTTNFAAPTNSFVLPETHDTRSFASSGGFAPPAPAFVAPATGFSSNPRFAPVAAAPVSRVVNLDSGIFAPHGGVIPTATSFGRSQPDITVVERTEYLNDNGEFSSSFRNSDGQSFSETGSLHPTNDQLDNVVVKQGQYSYTSPEGVPVSVTYTADEYGFHPVSNNIPQPVAPIAPTF